jgi:hypothetical protein
MQHATCAKVVPLAIGRDSPSSQGEHVMRIKTLALAVA